MSDPASRGRPRLRPTPSALVALLLLVPAPSIGVIAAMIVWPGDAGVAVFAAAKVWMIALPLVWWVAIDRRRPSLSPARMGGFRLGIGLGLLISGLIFLAFALAGPRLIDAEHVRAMAQQNGIGTPTRYLLAAVYWICVNSVLEEYVYRWFIFRKLEVLMPARLAVVGSAVCFTVHHVIALKVQFDWPVTVIGSVGVFAGGAIWSWLYARYQSIWPAYVSHAIVDVAVFAVGWRIIMG
ncbi:MAG: CPBP family intramembrane metalloprotease [Phycisphaerales bacterium]|nr:CPBP family intramembrane metalloprotease [Phycisphaerales bacterium]